MDVQTRKREFKPFNMININADKYILTLDTFDFSRGDITHMNIINFLKSDI